MTATMGTRTERLAGEVASSCESPLGSAWRDLLGFGHQPGKAMRVGGDNLYGLISAVADTSSPVVSSPWLDNGGNSYTQE